MKTLLFFIKSLILSVWDNLMEELSKMEFSREGFFIITGIVSFVVIGLIVMSIKERMERKKEQEHPPTPPPHHHHHHHHRKHHHKKRIKSVLNSCPGKLKCKNLQDIIFIFYMKKYFVSLILNLPISLFSQSGTTIIDSIYSNNLYRSYRLYIPANYSGVTSVPLILNLHGYTSNALQQQLYSNFMPIADTAGFLMVYPQGVPDIYYGNPFWNAGIMNVSYVDDTLFLNQLIDTLMSQYNIDPGRVFMTGLSNGGFMSHYMACFCNRKIKGIASVAGTWFHFWPTCNPGKVIPMLHIHGTADSSVPYYGNSTMLGADSTVQRWVIKNSCNPTPSYSMVPNINITDGSTAEHYQYFINSNPKSIVEFFKINNGAHTWPGAPYIIGTTNQDINASAEIWRFFRQFSSADFTTHVNLFNYNNAAFSVYPNPAKNLIFISSDETIKSISIIDLTGKIIFEKNIEGNKNLISINILHLDKGMYFLFINQKKFQTYPLLKEE